MIFETCSWNWLIIDNEICTYMEFWKHDQVVIYLTMCMVWSNLNMFIYCYWPIFSPYVSFEEAEYKQSKSKMRPCVLSFNKTEHRCLLPGNTDLLTQCSDICVRATFDLQVKCLTKSSLVQICSLLLHWISSFLLDYVHLRVGGIIGSVFHLKWKSLRQWILKAPAS